MAEVGDKDSTRALPSFEDSNWWPLLDAIAFTSLHFNSVKRAGLKLHRALVSDELLSIQERMDGERELLRGWGDMQFTLSFPDHSPGRFSESTDDCEIVANNESLDPHFIFVWGPGVERLCGLAPSTGPSETITELSAVVDEPTVDKPQLRAELQQQLPEDDQEAADEASGVSVEPQSKKRRGLARAEEDAVAPRGAKRWVYNFMKDHPGADAREVWENRPEKVAHIKLKTVQNLVSECRKLPELSRNLPENSRKR